MFFPLLVLAVVLLLASPAQAGTVLVDRPPGFGALPFDGVGDTEVGANALSSDGCFVVFSSHSDVLSATDDNAAENVFRLDLCRAGSPLAQVNTSSSGTPAEPFSDNERATISADGRYVAFSSDAGNLVPGVTAGQDEIFVKDLATGTLELASRGDGPSGLPAERATVGVISGHGRSVAFVASGVLDADNVDGAAGSSDVYVRTLDDDRTHMVSVKGNAHGGLVDFTTPPAIDHTGARIAFVTQSQLVAGDTDASFDAYVRHQVGGSGENTQLVSVGAGGARNANAVALSGDSTRVAYTNGRLWYATCAFACGGPIQADGLPPGVAGAEGPFFPRPVANGVAQPPTELYWRTPTPLDPADTDDDADLYGTSLTDPPAAEIFLMATGDGPVDGADVAGAGSPPAMVFGKQRSTTLPGTDGATRQVWLSSISGFTNISQPVHAPPRINGAGNASLGRRGVTSADGRLVAFSTVAPALGSPLGQFGYDHQVLVRDVVSGATTLVSVAPGNGNSFDASIDATGRRVAFISIRAGGRHIYVRDLHSGTTTLVTTADAERARISANGAAVVFESRSAQLPGAPGDGKQHIYRADLASGQIVLVDRSGSGQVANGDSQGPDVSADGNRVAFYSTATNLGGGTALNDDVYVRDLAAETTTWVSVPEDGDPEHSSARDPAISDDGRRVAFTQELAEFGHGAIDAPEIFVRDLAAATTTLVSTGPHGPADTGAIESSLSADGTKVTFISDARNLGGPVDRFRTAYVHDLGSRTTSPVAQGRSSEDVAVLSANGACVALQSGSDDLAPGYGPDFQHVFLHAIGAGCAPSAGGAPAPGADTTAPRISRLRMTRRRFAAGRRRTPLTARARRGTAFVFRLSEDARTTITITRRRQTVRLVRARTRAGVNRIAFTGRTRRRVLRPGRYRATVRATDAAGNRSAPRRVTFKVVRR